MDKIINTMKQQYLETLYFVEEDLLSEDYDRAEDYNFSQSAQYIAESDCKKFIELLDDKKLDDHDYSQIAHDFILTRNGHGAGFWDGDYSKNDEKILMEAVKSFSEVHLYIQHGFLQIEG